MYLLCLNHNLVFQDAFTDMCLPYLACELKYDFFRILDVFLIKISQNKRKK